MTLIFRASLAALALILASPALAGSLPVDCSKGLVPIGPVKGEISRAEFIPEKTTLRNSGSMTVGDAKFDTWTLKLSKSEGGFNEASADVTFLVPMGKKPEARNFRQIPGGIEAQPKAAEGLPEIQGWSFADDATQARIDSVFSDASSLQLHLGQRKGDAIAGSLYLCAPGDEASAWVGGTFTAEITE